MRISKRSNIKTKNDLKYGYVHLIHIKDLGQVKLYHIVSGKENKMENLIPNGSDVTTIKLQEGIYKLVYLYSSSQEVSRLFTIKTDMITDVLIK